MASFPTLTRRGSETHSVVVSAFEHQLAHDPVISSVADGGWRKTRARFTRAPRRFHVLYEWLTLVNKNLVQNFEAFTTYGGSDAFLWVHPENGSRYNVRFLGLATYTPQAHANYLWWNAEFDVEVV